MQVKIMRGLPGSGKSHFASQLFPKAVKVCTDDYFVDGSGVYRFDPSKLAEYHNSCLAEYLRLMSLQVPLIVVDNTNLRQFDIAPYIRLADLYGYKVEVIHILADPDKCVENNVHGVTGATIRRLASLVEPLPDWLNVRTIVNN